MLNFEFKDNIQKRLNNLSLFREKHKLSLKKDKMKVVSRKQENHLYASLFVACQLRNFDLENFFQHEAHCYPPSISEYGSLRKTCKSEFLSLSETYGNVSHTCPETSAKVIDGAVVVQMIKPVNVETFGDYARYNFIPYIKKNFQNEKVTRIDLVFDRYFPLSLKNDTRKQRGQGVRVSVKEMTPVWKNWNQFLKESDNKTELFKLLAENIVLDPVDGKILVAAKDDVVISNWPINTDTLCPTNQEEADTRIFLHLKHISQAGHRKVMIRTVDTDIVVIAIALYDGFDLDELWIEFGTGINQRWLPIHEYSLNLGKEVCDALPVWFAFTGCDFGLLGSDTF